MDGPLLRATNEQVAAAQLRLVLDEKLGRPTPELVRQIAAITGVERVEREGASSHKVGAGDAVDDPAGSGAIRKVVRDDLPLMLGAPHPDTQLQELLTQRLLLQTQRERRKIDVAVLEAEIDLLGGDNVAMRFFLAELAKMNVPEVVAGNAESLLDYMSLSVAHELIAEAFAGTPRQE